MSPLAITVLRFLEANDSRHSPIVLTARDIATELNTVEPSVWLAITELLAAGALSSVLDTDAGTVRRTGSLPHFSIVVRTSDGSSFFFTRQLTLGQLYNQVLVDRELVRRELVTAEQTVAENIGALPAHRTDSAERPPGHDEDEFPLSQSDVRCLHRAMARQMGNWPDEVSSVAGDPSNSELAIFVGKTTSAMESILCQLRASALSDTDRRRLATLRRCADIEWRERMLSRATVTEQARALRAARARGRELRAHVASLRSRLDRTEVLCALLAVATKPTSDTANVRERIPEAVRHEVWRRDCGRCVKCGSQLKLEFDHIIPFVKGGSNSARNLQLLCESCNRTKSDRI
ncbi:MAG TPA: HNH endonuclease signature motif containing protein [Humisphaera sp.]|jgi:5-methylcytosine-specific restriction endonuclease McrA|nr:HNH endonuclease signature motif containing protein [Humisphaera sp.]